MARYWSITRSSIGAPLFGTRLVVAQVDDETWILIQDRDYFSGFEAVRLYPARCLRKLEREVAYQWWGQTVGLKSFDDAWIAQGLAEWSAFAFRESHLTGGALEAAQREQQERALTFEQTASIARAPSALDDQSAAYQSIIFHKGAMIFACCRDYCRKSFDRCCITFSSSIAQERSIDNFEKLRHSSRLKPALFLCAVVEGTGVPEFPVDYQIIRTRSGKFRTRCTVKQTSKRSACGVS